LKHGKYFKWTEMEFNFFPFCVVLYVEVIANLHGEGVELSEIGLVHTRLLTNCLGSWVKLKPI